MKKSLIAVLVMLSVLMISCGGAKDDSKPSRTFVTIGTGGVTGVYYPTGGAISKIVNKKFDEYKKGGGGSGGSC